MYIVDENSELQDKETQEDRPNVNFWGMEKGTFLTILHLSQLTCYFSLGLGLILPIAMWATNSKDPDVNRHGKNVLNFILSILVYAIPFCAVFLHFNTHSLSGIIMMFLILILAVVVHIILIVIAAIKANRGKSWKYPFAIPFLK